MPPSPGTIMRPAQAYLAADRLAVLTAGAAVGPERRPTFDPAGSPAGRPHLPPPAPCRRLLKRQADPMIAQRTKGSATAPDHGVRTVRFPVPVLPPAGNGDLPVLEKEFIATGKVRWIFLNFPLTQLHANAAAAAEFSMCAARADKFWPIHDLLFNYQEKWAPLKDPAPFLITLADSAGIPSHGHDLLPAEREMQGVVRAESEGAAKSGVHSTPTVYIEGVGLLAGAAPVETFRLSA